MKGEQRERKGEEGMRKGGKGVRGHRDRRRESRYRDRFPESRCRPILAREFQEMRLLNAEVKSRRWGSCQNRRETKRANHCKEQETREKRYKKA